VIVVPSKTAELEHHIYSARTDLQMLSRKMAGRLTLATSTAEFMTVQIKRFVQVEEGGRGDIYVPATKKNENGDFVLTS
jgi:hypothetical protein